MSKKICKCGCATGQVAKIKKLLNDILSDKGYSDKKVGKLKGKK